MKFCRYIIIVLLLLCSAACNVTRNLSSDEDLLVDVDIKEDKSVNRKERIRSSEIKRYIKQQPNKRFLGANFYVWVHSLANSKKTNRWNNFKRKIGEEPVIFDSELTRQSVTNIRAFLSSCGYFSSEVDCYVDTMFHKKKARLTYSVKQNQPYRLGDISYDFKDRFLQPVILSDTIMTLLRSGDIFNVTTLNSERKRITEFLRKRGYYDFTINNIEYVADTVSVPNQVNLKMIVKQNLDKYADSGEPIFENNKVYRLRNINVAPKFNALKAYNDTTYFSTLKTIQYKGLNVMFEEDRPMVSPKNLRSNISLYPNAVFNSNHVTRTYSNLMKLGCIKSARIVFEEVPDSVKPGHQISYVGSKILMRDTLSTIHTKEAYLDCHIMCTPALKQSFQVELEGSTTSSFYGAKASVGYQNRNIFHGSELFEVKGSFAYEYMKSKWAKHNAIEFMLSTSLSIPRFLIFRASPHGHVYNSATKFELSFNYQNRPYYRRNIFGGSIAYSWKNRNNLSFVLKPISLHVVDVGYIDEEYLATLENKYLIHSYESQLVPAIAGSVNYSTSYQKLHGHGTTLRVNYELAGNITDALARMFASKSAGEDHYEIFGIRYSQYIRCDFSASHKIQFGEVLALAGRFYAGVGWAYSNSVAIPFDKMFYAGGSNSMRGWTARMLGPGSSKLPEDVKYPTQLGDMKLEANLELRFPIWGIFQGALFLDAGNVWYLPRESADYPEGSVFHFNEFYKQLGFNTGFGLRADIKFAILRLDWGVQLHNPNMEEGERWIHNFKWKGMALNFGVGFPF